MRSMTGFGANRLERDGWAAGVEVRTVNNKGLKLSLRITPSDAPLEPLVDKAIREGVRRGTVQLSVQLARTTSGEASLLNAETLAAYVTSARAEAAKLDLEPPSEITPFLTLPGVAETAARDEIDDEARTLAVDAVRAAVESLNAFRETEGEAMRVDLAKLAGEIRLSLTEIGARAPGVVSDYRDRINERVAELLRDSEASVPHETIIREVSVFAERADINEEITRLDAHLDQFLKQIDSETCEGRKLDFLGQEMFREINTIGSKANDLTISRHVVEMKSAAEKIREMVQNVE